MLNSDNKSKLHCALDIVLNLLLVVLLTFIIRSYIISPFHVYGPSMCDTLNNINGECDREYGDYIIVNKLIYLDIFGLSISDPKAGDVIVFNPPTDTKDYYVKRIIGVPGDRIKVENGLVYKWFDGQYNELDETEYLNQDNLGATYGQFGTNPSEFFVPEGKYFVMGDNRNQSTDSRRCFDSGNRKICDSSNEYAFVPKKNISGKAWIVTFPFQNIQVIKAARYDF